jgi:hypothetical protein
MTTKTFATWFNTFLDEKRIDREQVLTVDGPSGPNSIPVGALIDAILQAPVSEQENIKAAIVVIDFVNGDVLHFFRHLAQAIAI